MPPSDLLSAPRRAHLAAAAQAALADMSEEFEPLLQEELARLSQARARWMSCGDAAPLQVAAHDLHGLGQTYGVPLAGRIAASLGRTLANARAPAPLVGAHVDAILAVVREDAGAAGHPRGLALTEALEAAASRFW